MSDLHVLYSFPTRIGVPGIGTTAWHQVNGLIKRGVRVTLCCGSCDREISGVHRLIETMDVGRIPLPYRLLGLDRAMIWHDYRTSRVLTRHWREIDVFHGWPSGSLRSLSMASRLGIPTVLERPSSHTQQVYDVLQRECHRLGITMDKRHYAFPNARRLAREEAEFNTAQYLLCPSDFVAQTFFERGYDSRKLLRHQYGCDTKKFRIAPAATSNRTASRALKALFVGQCFPLKGLHFALEAWFASGAFKHGVFQICGRFHQEYRALLRDYLAHESVIELGFVSNVAEVMQECDVLVLPSLSEGSALVTYEARACGLVLLVSSATGACCTHLDDSLIHSPGSVRQLTEHFRMLSEERLRTRLRNASLDGVGSLDWSRAAARLHDAYSSVLQTPATAHEALAMPSLPGGHSDV